MDWAAALLEEARVKPDTISRYISHVTMVNDRVFPALTGPQRAMLSDAHASLKRKGAGCDVNQATAATTADMRKLWRDAPPRIALTATLLWATACRHGDLINVLTKDVCLPRLGEAQIKLRVTKTTTFGGGVRLVVCVIPPQAQRALEEHLRTETRLLLQTYPTFLKAVRRLCPRLTAHSFRRGAIQEMMERGVDDRSIMQLTGHKSRKALYRYAGICPRLWRERMMTASAAAVW